MKKLDLYIIQKFLVTFFFITAIIMSIAVIFDISEKIDDFISKKAPLNEIVLDYYLNFILHYGNLFSAFIIAISVILFTSVMANRTEIVAILGSGISFYRFLWPYFIASTILVVISLVLNHWVLPKANEQRLEFEYTYIWHRAKHNRRNIHREIKEGEYVYIYAYYPDQAKAVRFSYERWNKEGVLVYKLDAPNALWDSASGQWKLRAFVERKINGMEEKLRLGAELDTVFNVTPYDLNIRVENVESMNYTELNNFIEDQRMEGSEFVPFYEIIKHQRTSYPFATYILTLIGVSLSSRKVRGGIGVFMSAGFLICGIYVLCIKTTTVFATNAGLPAWLAVWIPNFLFAILGVYLLKRAPK